MKLKSDLQLSKDHQQDVATQLQYCENTIAELQTEISDFQDIVTMRVAETKNKEQSIQILQQLYKSSQEKVRYRIYGVNCLDQGSITVTDRENYWLIFV